MMTGLELTWYTLLLSLIFLYFSSVGFLHIFSIYLLQMRKHDYCYTHQIREGYSTE